MLYVTRTYSLPMPIILSPRNKHKFIKNLVIFINIMVCKVCLYFVVEVYNYIRG